MKTIKKIHMLHRIDHCDGPWWLWECEVEYTDGTTRTGSVTGDGHLCAEESLELDPLPPRKSRIMRWIDAMWERWFAERWNKS